MTERNSNGSTVVLWAGGVLVVAGALVLLGFGLGSFAGDLFGSTDVPLAIQIAVPAVVLGALILLGWVLIERLRSRDREHLGEVDY